MFDFDRSNFIAFLHDFPEQPVKSKDIVQSFSPKIDGSGIRHLVFSGMGGSAIAGEIFSSLFADQLPVPATVVRDYTLPAFVDSTTLFVACSYSGNTEETLSATEQAHQKGARILAISSGGRLTEFCQENNLPHLRIPEGFPPRQALGYLFFTVLFALEKIGLVAIDPSQVKETISLLEQLRDWYSPSGTVGHNLANHVAQSLYRAIPVIYTGAPFLSAVGTRWRNQINENAKALAFSNVLPEMNHNEIMGYEGPPDVNQFFRVIFLRDGEEHPRTVLRIEITKKILREKKVPILEVFSEGQSRLARLFSLIYIGDWVSYYLAMLYEKDPIDIDSINRLKAELAQRKQDPEQVS